MAGRFPLSIGAVAGLLARLRRDRRGVGAIEFAFIAPVMIVLYIGALEMSVAMSVNKKLARAASTVADIITQSGETDKTKLKTMVNVARSIMAPYDPEPVALKISMIEVDASGMAYVRWSWMPNDGNGEIAYPNDSETDVPENLRIPQTFLLRSEIAYRHDMITTFPITGETMTGIDMGKTYHLRARVGDKVECAQCRV